MIQWGTQFYKDMIEFWKKIIRKEANILPLNTKVLILFSRELNSIQYMIPMSLFGNQLQSDLFFLCIDR